MKILFITDVHYGSDSNYPKYPKGLGEAYVNSFGSRFETYVPSLRNTIKEHDLVVNLGDLINETSLDTEDIERYKKALSLLEGNCPVKNVVGNHDLNNMSREQVAQIIKEEKLYYSFDLGGYHHVVLDGYRETKANPHSIQGEQIQWLEEDISAIDLPVLVYCHYPLDEQDLQSNYYFSEKPERGSIVNRGEVREILERSQKVIAVFGGHVHFFNQERIHGIEYITVPSFSENNGTHEAKAQCLSFEINGTDFVSRWVAIERT